MKKRNPSKNRPSEKIRREKDPIPWRYCLLTLVCGAFLVGGFFFAARSHFASIEFGIKNSTLKKQVEDLQAEKRRLIWMKETALSPAEIKKAAKKIGLAEMTASNSDTTRSAAATKNDKAPAAKKTEEKPKPLIEKTIQTKPVEKNGKNGAAKTTADDAKKASNPSTQTAKK